MPPAEQKDMTATTGIARAAARTKKATDIQAQIDALNLALEVLQGEHDADTDAYLEAEKTEAEENEDDDEYEASEELQAWSEALDGEEVYG